jgi:cell division protein FtsL
MLEYIVELFEKPAIMLTTLEQIIITVIIVICLILIFAILFGIIALAETIQERKERKEWERRRQ